MRVLWLTFVTASWKCSSETCCAVLFVNANNKQRNASLLVFRLAIMSTLRLVLLTTALCSLGSCGAASGGRAEEKLHSSSSCAAAAA